MKRYEVIIRSIMTMNPKTIFGFDSQIKKISHRKQFKSQIEKGSQ